MQPISLKLESFGPYENSTIDFSNYYTHSLFLITGKTGSGKTTIFDGMSYALYGSTSGGVRQGKEMRSNFAELGQKTKVTFKFKQEGKTYEVEREPEQLVNKLRGEGTREQPAGVRLTVYDEGNKEINQLTKQKDVGIFLSELIHLNEQQFSQIVMLPQGEFRRFLVADSDSKEKVLRKLFNTYFYQDIAESLRQKKKKSEAELKTISQELSFLVFQLEFQSDFTEENLEDLYYQDVLKMYEEQQLIYAAEIKKRSHELQVVQGKQLEQQQLIQEEKKWLSYFEEQEVVLNQITLLESQVEMIELKKSHVSLLKNSQQIEPTVNYLSELGLDKEKNTKKEQELLEQQVKSQAKLAEAQVDLGELLLKEAEIKTYEQKLSKIEASIPLFEKKQIAEETRTQLKQKVTQMLLMKEELTHKQKELEQESQDLKALLGTEPDLLKEDFRLKNELENLSKKQTKIQEFRQQESALKLTQEDLLTSQEELSSRTQKWKQELQIQKQLKSDWAKAQIAKLSLAIIEGEPCPVCGSKEHPDLSHGQEVTKEEMNQLEQDLELSEDLVTETREELVTLESQINFKEKETSQLVQQVSELMARIRDYFEKNVHPDEWAEMIQKEYQIVKESNRAVQIKLLDVKSKKEVLELVNQNLGTIEMKLATQEKELREVENQHLQTETSVNDLKEQLPKNWENLADMLVEQEELKNKISHWTKKMTHIKEIRAELEQQLLILKTTLESEHLKKIDVLEKIAREETKLEKFLKSNELELSKLRELLKELPQLDQIMTEISAFEKQEYALKEQENKLKVLLKNKEKPEIEGFLIIEEALSEEVKAKQNELGTLEHQVKNNQKIVTAVLSKEAAMKDSLDALEELTELANVMTGDGPNKLSMERFVLQTYLKKILERANEKLHVLTNGRYRFELKEEQGSFKKKTGLEINVYDDNAGAIRSVNTLSGGESFIAALSLALSLAEVIQEEAGGITIDAMFIDEGFGSLDEDALEMAIRALESIEGEGRLIGIISHVRELKERIPQQLQVKTTVNGKSYVEERLEFE